MAGLLAGVLARGWAGWVVLTEAWHLDDLHLSRPESRRTELSPGEFIFQERSGLGYKYVGDRMV